MAREKVAASTDCCPFDTEINNDIDGVVTLCVTPERS